tara:strand:+ start:1585 stop:2610 length:1026 start_codon:yes stop_codon:yes gene_type:complete
MSAFLEISDYLKNHQKKWLITGVAGFIGSNLLEYLLRHNQEVVGLDNFSTGYKKNLEEVKSRVTPNQWKQFSMIEGDITNYKTCQKVTNNVNYVLHQAALGSVPRSIADPVSTNYSNVTGFLNILHSAQVSEVDRFVYAASSSTYGDHPALPKTEENIGNPLSPYAVSKYVNELYAQTFFTNFKFSSIGLRYFNIFGKRQDPNGAYAAVIPKWVKSMINGEEVFINGDGETSRDFCYIDNAIQANILSATQDINAGHHVLNIAVGQRTSLNDLSNLIKKELEMNGITVSSNITYRDFRYGDVRHSQASIKKAKEIIAYEPAYKVDEGIRKAIGWYIKNNEE